MIKQLPALRPLPYPLGDREHIGAIISISSDIDDTSLKFFRSYHFYIDNYKLKLGDSFFGIGNYDLKIFFWRLQHGQSILRVTGSLLNMFLIIRHVKSGYLDSIHSFIEASNKGHFFFRVRLKFLIFLLNLNKAKIDTWIDHGQSMYNFGDKLFEDRFYYNKDSKQGDDLNSRFYHTDLTINNASKGLNIKFAWHHYSPFDPTLSKEQDYRHWNEFRGFGNNIYSTKDILYPDCTKDGKPYFRFFRFYNSYIDENGLLVQPNNSNLEDSINEIILDQIAKSGLYSIIATHLGTPIKSINLFKTKNERVLRLLRNYINKNLIHLTYTSRLLNYAWVLKYIDWNHVIMEEVTNIYINYIDDKHTQKYIPNLNDLAGVTFYVTNPEKTTIYIDGTEIKKNYLSLNESDGKHKSVTIGRLSDL